MAPSPGTATAPRAGDGREAPSRLAAPGGASPAATGDATGRHRPPGLVGTIMLPPWRRAPALLLRQPGAALAVLVATAILGIAAASGPLFLGSAATGAAHRILGSYCPEQSRPGVQTARGEAPSAAPARRATPSPELVRRAAAAEDAAVRRLFAGRGLGAPERVIYATGQDVAGRAGSRPAVLFARPGVLDHVTVLAGSRSTAGVWVSDLTADELKVRPGDSVRVAGGRIPVAGVYRDLVGRGYGGDLPRYWCTWSDLIVPKICDGCVTGALVLADADTLVGLGDRASLEEQWYSPVGGDRLTVRDAADVGSRSRLLASAVLDSQPELPPGLPFGQGPYRDSGHLADAADRAGQVRSGLRGMVTPIAAVATLIALCLVGAAGVYWTERRAGEIRLLAARGVGPVALGVKAVLELLVAAVAGGLLGWLVAVPLIRRLGPSALLEQGATGQALGTVAAAVAAGLVLLGVVAAGRARSMVEGPRGRRRLDWLALVPWEAVLLASALAGFLALRRSGGVTVSRDVVRLDPRVVVVPLLAVAGGVAVAGRLLAASLPLLGRVGGRLPVAGYLASRRLAASRTVTVGVVLAVALPVGMLAFSRSLVASMDEMTSAKAGAYAGAPVAMQTSLFPGRELDQGGHGTHVSVLRDATLADGLEAEVIGVDPATFARYALWSRAYSTVPLPELLGRLGTPRAGEPVPAVLVRPRQGGENVTEVALRSTRLPVRVVGRADGFPGTRLLDAPVLVVSRAALGKVDIYSDRSEEIWTTAAERDAAVAAVNRAGVQVTLEVRPAQVLGNAVLYPLTWAFGYLTALAVLTGLISVAGLLLYLGARQRGRVASYALSRRMGLSRRAHLCSMLVELAVVVILGAGTGVAAAVLTLRPVVPLVDVDRLRPPPPLVQVPGTLLAAIGVGGLLLVVLGALAGQWAADRSRPSDVLRLGG